MAKQVIIHMPGIGSDPVSWAFADEKGQVTSDIHEGTLEEVAQAVEGRRAVLVVPGDGVLLAEATIPGGSQSRAQQAVPYALEEFLADDVDDLHFALGSKRRGDIYPVAVIGRDSMDALTAQCAEAGLRPAEVVPETLALPKFDSDVSDEATWTAFVDAHQAVVWLNGFKGFSSDTGMMSMLLDGARRDLPEEGSASLVVYQSDPQLTFETPAELDVEQRACDHRLSLYASGLATSPRINLLQGDYSPKTRFDRTWKPWRSTLALAAVALVVLFGGKWLEYRQLAREEAWLDRQIARGFSDAMPGVRMQRPLAQIRQRLRELDGGADTSGFTADMQQIAASLAAQPQTTVRSIGYRDGRFDLDILTDSIPSLDALKTDLQQRGSLNMVVQSTNTDRDGLRSRIRIEQ